MAVVTPNDDLTIKRMAKILTVVNDNWDEINNIISNPDSAEVFVKMGVQVNFEHDITKKELKNKIQQLPLGNSSWEYHYIPGSRKVYFLRIS